MIVHAVREGDRYYIPQAELFVQEPKLTLKVEVVSIKTIAKGATIPKPIQKMTPFERNIRELPSKEELEKLSFEELRH